mgnify:CR=1 FL=1
MDRDIADFTKQFKNSFPGCSSQEDTFDDPVATDEAALEESTENVNIHIAGSPDDLNQTFSENFQELDSSEDEIIDL